jgi:hypothetical protein
MCTKQVSVLLENRRGRLAEVTKLLSDEGINIRALSLADMSDLGVLRLIVNDRERCLRVLKASGFAVQETDVVAVEMEDKPGGLHRIIRVLDENDVNIEYMYTCLEKNSQNAIVVLRIDDSARAVEAMRNNGFSILPETVIQNL